MKKIVKLSHKAFFEYNRLKTSQELLEVAREQIASKPQSFDKRVDLLLESYLALTSLYLDELRTALDNIQQQAKAKTAHTFTLHK